MWVRFVADWDRRLPQATVAYKAGWSGNVPHEAGEAAIAAGKAVRLKPPRKGEVADEEA